ncbi:MAG: hypothetical protein JWL84_3367 [Rhodospirillales bacterium]|nr:hypothetical protein [Rhodospirillales bacterium]
MKFLPAIGMLLALSGGTAAADEILNPPGAQGGFLNGKLAGPTASGIETPPWSSDIGRLEEDAVFAGAYNRSRVPRFWGGASVPVWRAGGVSGALIGALAKGPGGVPVVRLGTLKGTSGLVFRAR